MSVNSINSATRKSGIIGASVVLILQFSMMFLFYHSELDANWFGIKWLSQCATFTIAAITSIRCKFYPLIPRDRDFFGNFILMYRCTHSWQMCLLLNDADRLKKVESCEKMNRIVVQSWDIDRFCYNFHTNFDSSTCTWFWLIKLSKLYM